ncbi:MAG: hypothetical protein IAE95_02505 [Chitinophagaceae bacterium]|nr:hypothetical protein [Chitinophagaceae bacterium]
MKEQDKTQIKTKADEIAESTLLRHALMESLVEGADALTAKEAKAKKEADEKIKFLLLNGKETSVYELKRIVSDFKLPYAPKFPNAIPFYKEIYRLNKWTDKDPNSFIKPPIVGVWTIELIYGRFAKEVLPALRERNPLMFGFARKFKLFQFLYEDGQKKIEEFRDDAIRIMKTCSTWHEFRVKYAKEFGIPFQASLFDKNSI